MKKSLMVFMVSAVFIGLIFLPACKSEKEIDIRGVWNHTSTILTTETGIMTFAGDSDSSGTCIESTFLMNGTWTRTGTNVVCILNWFFSTYTWTLTIENNNLMTGTCVTSILPGVTGTSTLTR